MSETPEHDKLRAVQPLSQAIGEFLEWLSSQGIHLAEYEGRYLHTTHRSITSLLSQFFDIDLDALDDEKRAILDSLHKTTNTNNTNKENTTP